MRQILLNRATARLIGFLGLIHYSYYFYPLRHRVPPRYELRTKKRNIVVYTGTPADEIGVRASISSIIQINTTPVEFYYIGEGPLGNEFTFVNFINVSSLDLEKYNWNPIAHAYLSKSKTVFARYELPSLFADQHHLMYIDSDTIVKCDVAELFDTIGKTSFAVAAAPSPSVEMDCVTNRKIAKEVIPNFDQIKHSFNNGIFLINIPKWNTDHVTEHVVHYLSENAKRSFFSCQHQPAMNFAIGEQFERLDARWNVYGLGWTTVSHDTLDNANSCFHGIRVK